MPKAARVEVIEKRQQNPCATLQEIASSVGISRERVRQILKSSGQPTIHWAAKALCLNCRKPIYKRRHFCNMQCQWEYTHPEVECHYCHQLFRRAQGKLYNLQQEHSYCSEDCRNKAWADRTWGQVEHKHSTKPRVGRVSPDTEYVSPTTLVSIYFDEGLTIKEVASRCGITEPVLRLLFPKQSRIWQQGEAS